MTGLERILEWRDRGDLVFPSSPNTVDLMRAVAMLCGVSGYAGEPGVSALAESIGAYDHYLFVIIDGMGMNHAGALAKIPFFKDREPITLSAVFPSTTAAALTSIATAEWPARHGLIGWFTHLPEYGKTIIPLPFVERDTETPLSEYGIYIADIARAQSIIPKFRRDCKSYLRKDIISSTYSTWARGYTDATAYGNSNRILRRLAFSLPVREHPSFSYLYVSDVDSLSHKLGHTDPAVERMLTNLGRDLDFLSSRVSGAVRIIVTTDHGLVEVEDDLLFIMTQDHPLMEFLEVPPSGEQRSPIFHVRPKLEDRFVEVFDRLFGEYFALMTPEEGVDLGLFGTDGISPEARPRLGTYIGVTPRRAAIEYVYPEKKILGFKGLHGGLHRDEMVIPLYIS